MKLGLLKTKVYISAEKSRRSDKIRNTRKLESFAFDGDRGLLRLDPVEVCQILNLNPASEEDLIAYLPTLKRFSEYQLSLFLED